MAAFAFDAAINLIATGALNLSTDTLKLMLVTSSYAAAKTDTSVTTAAAAEIAATGYTGGFAGAGRKSAPRTIVNDTAANVIRMVLSGNTTWTALGGVTNSTIAAAVLIKEITNDAGSIPVAYLPLALAVTTNGSDFTLTRDAVLGNLTFTLV